MSGNLDNLDDEGKVIYTNDTELLKLYALNKIASYLEDIVKIMWMAWGRQCGGDLHLNIHKDDNK